MYNEMGMTNPQPIKLFRSIPLMNYSFVQVEQLQEDLIPQ